ncbi:MAG TPA: S24 family peptidase, partial [Methylococcales bacterium]
MNALSRKQKEIMDFLQKNQHIFVYPPTLDELCAALGLKSRGSLHRLIQGLIETDLIEHLDRKRPGIRLTERARKIARETTQTPNSLRYVGIIAAGKPIEAIEDERFMSIPDEIKTDKPCYVLKVKGDSMIEEGIYDGDWVVIEQRCHARNGEIVVA